MESEPEIVYELVPEVVPEIVPETVVEPEVVPETVVVHEVVAEPVVVAETVDESNLSANIAIAVKSAPIILATRVNVSPSSPPTLTIQAPTLQFTAVVLPSTTTNKTVTWSSSNTSVATINSSTGLATRVGYGSTIIRATTTDGSNKASAISLRVR